MDADSKLTPERAFSRIFSNEKYAKRLTLMMRYLREASRTYDNAVAEIRRVMGKRIMAEIARSRMADAVAAIRCRRWLQPQMGSFRQTASLLPAHRRDAESTSSQPPFAAARFAAPEAMASSLFDNTLRKPASAEP